MREDFLNQSKDAFEGLKNIPVGMRVPGIHMTLFGDDGVEGCEVSFSEIDGVEFMGVQMPTKILYPLLNVMAELGSVGGFTDADMLSRAIKEVNDGTYTDVELMEALTMMSALFAAAICFESAKTRRRRQADGFDFDNFEVLEDDDDQS